MYVVQIKHKWSKEWKVVYGSRWGKYGHSTKFGAKIHQRYWDSRHKTGSIWDFAETRIVKV